MADTGKPNPDNVGSDTKTKLHWLEIAYFSGQIVLAIVGIWALVIYSRQLSVMRGTLDEMKRAGEQSTEQMWSAIGNINWMAHSMDLSQQQSQKSLQATIDNFHQEQRAWVGVSTLGIVGGTLAKGNTISEIVTLSNLGRTPAQHCYMQTGVNLLTPDHELVIDYSLPKGSKPSWTTVPPSDHPNGVTAKLKDTNGGIAVLDEAEFAKLKTGDHLFYVFGRIFYKDVFNAKHHTFFCGVMNPDLTTFHDCQNNYHDEN